MICKKCGREVLDTAKFCAYCGNSMVEMPLPTEPVQSIEQSPSVNLEASVIQPNINVEPTSNLEEEKVSEPSVQNLFGNQTQINNQNAYMMGQQMMQQPVMQEQPVVEQAPVSPEKKEEPKKINKLVFIIGGAVLAVVAIVLIVLAAINSSNNSVAILERAIGNFKGTESGTVKAKIVLESSTDDTFNLSADVKFAKIGDRYDVALTLNKSALFDEINMYSSISDKEASLYIESMVVDMLGMTESDSNIWLYYTMPLDDIVLEKETAESEKIDFKDILDSKHFKYVDTYGDLKHYELIIDNALLERIKANATGEEKAQLEDSLNTITSGEEFTDTYILDLYINSSDKLEKISMDLTDIVNSEDYSSVVFSFEFTDFNNTTVTIPKDALESINGIDAYISTNSIYGSSDETLTEPQNYEYGF